MNAPCIVVAKTANGPCERFEIFLLDDEPDAAAAARKVQFILSGERGPAKPNRWQVVSASGYVATPLRMPVSGFTPIAIIPGEVSSVL